MRMRPYSSSFFFCECSFFEGGGFQRPVSSSWAPPPPGWWCYHVTRGAARKKDLLCREFLEPVGELLASLVDVACLCIGNMNI